MQKFNHNIEFEIYQYDELGRYELELVRKAESFARNAYAPYSTFKVGAAVKLVNGIIVGGSNQENVAFPSGLCAERVALFSAAAQYPKVAPSILAIVGLQNEIVTERPIYPCGSCLQVLQETEMRYNKKICLFLCGRKNIMKIQTSSHLMPFAFVQPFSKIKEKNNKHNKK